MSRREEEFKHRTSIFEGAFRAWSHLGGLDPETLFHRSTSVDELDPITYPLVQDTRLSNKNARTTNGDGSSRTEYPYEPLPRSGVSHPFVKAILSPWLGPNADTEAVDLGLQTLRTWWQHRRKGESKSAVKTLRSPKMKVIVDKYTRHFFDLAHCLVVSDKVQPPRTLQVKMKQLEKQRRETMSDGEGLSASSITAIRKHLTDPNLTPLEKMHAAQKHQLEGMSSADLNAGPLVNVKGKCIPGNIDLPGIVDAVSRHATQLAHRGGLLSPNEAPSSGQGESVESFYGDPNTTPVVFINRNSDCLIVLEVNGISCAHCVKIVETVLRGCNGGKSPISGLLDAAADRGLSSVIIKIDEASSAKRIAFEATRNLSMVGYTAKPKEVILSAEGDVVPLDGESMYGIFVRLANKYPFDYFDFAAPCTCPDSGVFRENCSRHSQMDERMFRAFASHEQMVADWVQSRNLGPNSTGNEHEQQYTFKHQQSADDQTTAFSVYDLPTRAAEKDLDVEPYPLMLQFPPRATFDQSVGGYDVAPRASDRDTDPRGSNRGMSFTSERGSNRGMSFTSERGSNRGMSFTSDRGSNRGMSFTSEFGNTMTGISALAIDWEAYEPLDYVEMNDETGNSKQPATRQGITDASYDV